MRIDELRRIIQASGGRDNALAYADGLLAKINRVASHAQYAQLITQLRSAHEEGDFRGRVLEVNFADCFIRAGVPLVYGAKQNMTGDIDFAWQINEHKLFIEMKLLGQDRATRDDVARQLEDSGLFATFVNYDIRDVARLQSDLMHKATTRKFNPAPDGEALNLIAVDVSELQLGTVDTFDCLLAAGGTTMTGQFCDSVYLREPVVGIFDDLPTNQLSAAQRTWLATVQRLPSGAPHPRMYIHGAIFLFREPTERAALAYSLRAVLVWNVALVDKVTAKGVEDQFHAVIPAAI